MFLSWPQVLWCLCLRLAVFEASGCLWLSWRSLTAFGCLWLALQHLPFSGLWSIPMFFHVVSCLSLRFCSFYMVILHFTVLWLLWFPQFSRVSNVTLCFVNDFRDVFRCHWMFLVFLMLFDCFPLSFTVFHWTVIFENSLHFHYLPVCSSFWPAVSFLY